MLGNTTRTYPDPYLTDQNHAPGVVVAMVITIIPALLLLAARFYTRFGITKRAGKEDWVLLVAAVSAMVYNAMICGEVHYGLGRHEWTISPVRMVEFMKFRYHSFWSYVIAVTLCKISIMLLLLRIFTGRVIRTFTWTFLAISATWGILTFFGSIFMCHPVQFFWSLNRSSGKQCTFDVGIYFTWLQGINLLQDLVILALPLPMVKDLMIPLRQKMVLFAMLGFGLVVIIICAVRLHFQIKLRESKDTTWTKTSVALLSVLELNITLICGCLLVIKPLVMRLLGRRPPRHSMQVPAGGSRRFTSQRRATGLRASLPHLSLSHIPIPGPSYARHPRLHRHWPFRTPKHDPQLSSFSMHGTGSRDRVLITTEIDQVVETASQAEKKSSEEFC